MCVMVCEVTIPIQTLSDLLERLIEGGAVRDHTPGNYQVSQSQFSVQRYIQLSSRHCFMAFRAAEEEEDNKMLVRASAIHGVDPF